MNDGDDTQRTDDEATAPVVPEPTPEAEPEDSLVGQVLDDRLVVLDMKDSGTGIDPKLLDRVCEPFFTTKSGDGKKGLGLSIVHRVVDDVGGTISIESEQGQGTHVRLSWPVQREGLHLV